MASISEITAKIEELENRLDVVEEMERAQAVCDARSLEKENEELRAENEALKVMIQKYEYRVNHLIRSLEEEEKKMETVDRLQYRINHLIRSLNEAENGTSGVSTSGKPAVEEADPFWSINLVVGRIVSAHKHPKANKLICEVIDCGEFGQERRIVSGLYPHYQPEDLEGKRVIIFANLKEALLLESPSHGMVLCACSADHSHIEILEPPADAAPGTRVVLESIPSFNTATEEINSRAKKNKWSFVQPELRVDLNGEAVYKGYHLVVDGKRLKAATLKDAPIS